MGGGMPGGPGMMPPGMPGMGGPPGMSSPMNASAMLQAAGLPVQQDPSSGQSAPNLLSMLESSPEANQVLQVLLQALEQNQQPAMSQGQGLNPMVMALLGGQQGGMAPPGGGAGLPVNPIGGY